MKHVEDVFKELSDKHGKELFDITKKADELTEDQAEDLMENWLEKATETLFGD